MAQKIIHIINNAQISSQDMSGGERIAMGLAQAWSNKAKLVLYSSNLGINIWHKYKLNQIKKIKLVNLTDPSSVISYFKRSLAGIRQILKTQFKSKDIIYSASDFWPDFLPGLIGKLKNPQIIWLAGFYLFARPPWRKDSPYKRNWFKGFLYWLTQVPVYYLTKKYADFILVTNQLDAKKFASQKTIVIQGGLDFKKVVNQKPKISEIKYQAVFIGRFHPQKGLNELINIWADVVKKIPQAKLALIGQGPEEVKIRHKIKQLDLNKNIDLLGFLDGRAKIKVISSAKIVVHPAVYDSGGMAPIEAMACGLPGVSFDLPALKTYYPQGMLKTACFDQGQFAQNIIKLLANKNMYKKLSRQAVELAKTWDWSKKADQVWQKING